MLATAVPASGSAVIDTRPASAPFNAHCEIRFTEHDARDEQRSDEASTRRDVGVDEHLGDRIGFVDVAHLQLATAVEAEPTEPEDKHTERGERHVGTRHRLHLAVRTVLSFARPQEQDTRQGCCRTTHVHDTRACKVLETGRIQCATAPLPESLHGVNEAGHDHSKSQEHPKLHPFCHRTGNDGHGRRHEHDLEEVVRTSRVISVTP